jgi:hypothetical protein
MLRRGVASAQEPEMADRETVATRIGAGLGAVVFGAISVLVFLWALGVDVAHVDPAYGETESDTSDQASRVAYMLTALTFALPLIPVGIAWYLADRAGTFAEGGGSEVPPRVARVLCWTGVALTIPAVGIGGNIVIVSLFFVLVGGP